MRRIRFHLIKAFIECLLHKRHAAAGVGGPVGKSSDTRQNEIRTIRKRRYQHRAGAKEEGVVCSECFSWIPGKKEPGTKSSPVTLYRGSKSRAEVGSEASGVGGGETRESAPPADSRPAENPVAAQPRGPSPGEGREHLPARHRASCALALASHLCQHSEPAPEAPSPSPLGGVASSPPGAAGEARGSVSTGCPAHRHGPSGPAAPLGLWRWLWWLGLYDYRSNISRPYGYSE